MIDFCCFDPKIEPFRCSLGRGFEFAFGHEKKSKGGGLKKQAKVDNRPRVPKKTTNGRPLRQFKTGHAHKGSSPLGANSDSDGVNSGQYAPSLTKLSPFDRSC